MIYFLDYVRLAKWACGRSMRYIPICTLVLLLSITSVPKYSLNFTGSGLRSCLMCLNTFQHNGILTFKRNTLYLIQYTIYSLCNT